jgi:hypothetical protein
VEVVYEGCAGLDAHKNSITAYVLGAWPKGKKKQAKRRCTTFKQELLADWLQECGVTHGEMESTATVSGFESLYLGLTSDNASAERWPWANGPSTNLPTAYYRSTAVLSASTYISYRAPGPGASMVFG